MAAPRTRCAPSPRLRGEGRGEGGSPRTLGLRRIPLTRRASRHSRCFASAFLALRTAAEGRLCSPRKRGEVEAAAIRQRGCEWVPSGKPGRRALNAADSDDRRAAQARMQPWLKLAALVLVVAALGLPVNDLFRYALLVIATVLVVAGTVAARAAPWLAAIVAVAVCVPGQILFAAPRIEEGHNVFLVDDTGGGGGALAAGLPRTAFQLMATEFNTIYPPARRCARGEVGCWRGQTFPDRAFAFSADGIFDHAAYSRRVTGIDFSDPVHLRLGFINELGYNWNSRASDVVRARRDRSSLAFLHQWTLAMPWFVLYRFPADFVGSGLCWRGEVLWERADGTF